MTLDLIIEEATSLLVISGQKQLRVDIFNSHITARKIKTQKCSQSALCVPAQINLVLASIV